MAILNKGASQGAFVNTTNVWDTAELEDIDVTKPEFKELLVRLYQNLNLMANVVNIKDTGYYFNDQEFVNGQQFFSNPSLSSSSSTTPAPRQVFRVVVNFGALPNNMNKPIAHGIIFTANSTITRLYGAATDPSTPEYVPIPYASASGDDIELYVDGTNVNITTNSNWSAYTITYVIIEYLKT
jgi:hypothetical protein